MKRTPLKRGTKLLKRTPLARTPKVTSTKKTKPKLEAWIKAIPESQSHGSGTYQKRLWRLVSDYVRIRDWYRHKVCTATGKPILDWRDGQAGHLKPYSNCNALYKFDIRNIHLQSASSNKWGNRDTWKDYEETVRARGFDIDGFERENRQAQGSSLRDSEVKEEIRRMLGLMGNLPIKPEYFERAYHLSKEL